MALLINERQSGKVVEVTVSDKLTKADYEKFRPEIEREIQQHGKIRILFQMHDFHGWDAGGLWEDLKFDAKHFNDIERLAMVGDKQWEKGMASFCKPFTTAKIRFFTPDEVVAARQWLEE